jgi:hypothetical protein
MYIKRDMASSGNKPRHLWTCDASLTLYEVSGNLLGDTGSPEGFMSNEQAEWKLQQSFEIFSTIKCRRCIPKYSKSAFLRFALSRFPNRLPQLRRLFNPEEYLREQLDD